MSHDGPDLRNMKTPAHNVQWQNPGLHQFSLELESAPYYLDLKSCMTQQISSSSNAAFTLSGCGISGLDGEYYITNDQDGNEIWVEKNNAWAIVFTNDANYTPEFCRSTGGTPTTANPTKAPTNNPTVSPSKKPTPNPTKMPATLTPSTEMPTSEMPTKGVPSTLTPSTEMPTSEMPTKGS